MISAADFAGLFGPPPGWVIVAADGTVSRVLPAEVAILPGSFNPVHEAHWRLAQTAEQILGRPVLFELSVHNVDKPALTRGAVQRRLQPFHEKASVVLTCAPLFAQKAQHFPRSVFVIGADTAARLVDVRYYGRDVVKLLEAFSSIRDAGCRFLVAARKDDSGKLITLEDLNVPTAFRNLFTALSPNDFQLEVSSTKLRSSPIDPPKDSPKPPDDPLTARLRESVSKRRPWTVAAGLGLLALLLVSCATLVFFFQPMGDTGPIGAVTFDLLVPKDEDAEVRVQLFSLETQGSPRLSGRELWFELPLEPGIDRPLAQTDGAGAARARWRPPGKVSEFRLLWFDGRVADQARAFVLPATASLVLVDVETTLATIELAVWKKENIHDIPAPVDAGEALREIAAKDSEIIYLALGSDEAYVNRRIRGWMDLRFAEYPLGPVLGRDRYERKSDHVAELSKVVASIRKKFTGPISLVVGKSELAKVASQLEITTFVLNVEAAPPGCIAVRDWSGLARHLK